MTKLCPRGKAAAKRKFRVYPSAYANAYASRICAGKIKDPSGVKRKDFKGRKPSAMGGRVYKAGGGLTEATQKLRRQGLKNGSSKKNFKDNPEDRFGKNRKATAKKSFPDLSGDGKVTMKDVLMGRGVIPRKKAMGGGMAQIQGFGKARTR